MNSVFLRLIDTKEIIVFIFGCWLLPEKFSYYPKNNGFARVPSPLAHTPMVIPHSMHIADVSSVTTLWVRNNCARYFYENCCNRPRASWQDL